MLVLFKPPSQTHQNQIDIQIVNQTTLAAILILTLGGGTLFTWTTQTLEEEWVGAGGPGPAGDPDYPEVTQEADLDGIWTDHFGIKIFHCHCKGDYATATFQIRKILLMKPLLDSSILGDCPQGRRIPWFRKLVPSAGDQSQGDKEPGVNSAR